MRLRKSVVRLVVIVVERTDVNWSYIFINCKLSSSPCELADSNHTCYYLVKSSLMTSLKGWQQRSGSQLFHQNQNQNLHHHIIIQLLRKYGHSHHKASLPHHRHHHHHHPLGYHAADQHHEESGECRDGHLVSSTNDCRARSFPRNLPPPLL